MEEVKVPSEVRAYFMEFSGELSEDAKVCQNASCVWNWLKQNEAPAEIIGAFYDLCERLGVPYVIYSEREAYIGCERCNYPVRKDWAFCPQCGKAFKNPGKGAALR